MKLFGTLKKNYEFKKVLTKGKRLTGEYLNIFIKKNDKNKNYIGIAINTKVAKANKRNRLKRLIRENYRKIDLKTIKGNDIVFLWRKDKAIEEVDFYKIQTDMINIFEKENLLKK